LEPNCLARTAGFAIRPVSFVIMSTTVGQQLRRKREERQQTIDEVASATRIRIHYVKAMEAGEFQTIPSMVQARGFLRAYADYLGMDSDLLLKEFDGKTIPIRTVAPELDLPTEARAQDAKGGNNSQAGGIFQEVGQALQHQRELLGLSLEDVERHTHLRQRYLVALEAGDLQGLPSPVQGRGMLNNYATFLGMNPEPLLLRFAEGLQARRTVQAMDQPEKRPARAKKRKSRLPAPLRRIFSGDLLIGLGLAFFLLIFVAWLAVRIFSMTSQENVTPTALSINEVLLATATPSQTPTPLPVTPTAPAPPQPFPVQAVATDALTGATLPAGEQTGVQIYITVGQRGWLRAIVDGTTEYDGRVVPGSAYTFSGDSTVEILTGNAGGLQVTLNGIDLGTMGNFGQVADRVYTRQGVVTPTPTITPTPTQTVPAPPTQIPAVQTAQATAPALP
jgi:cytoskeleton protein RodZ